MKKSHKFPLICILKNVFNVSSTLSYFLNNSTPRSALRGVVPAVMDICGNVYCFLYLRHTPLPNLS